VMTLPAGTTTTIALDTAVGDPDGKPDCVSAYAVGTDVYVACDVLDSTFTPRGPGKVAVIDTTTDTVRTTITLPANNPLGFFQRTPVNSAYAGDLVIATVPSFDTYTSGCLVRIVPSATPEAGCASFLQNNELGGFVNAIAIGAEKMYLSVVVDQNFSTASGQVRVVDLATADVATSPLSSGSELITDLAACPDGSVVAVDATMNAAGVRVFQGATERTSAPIAIGLPPVFSTGVVCYDAQ
jgi:DNA-binding beta-propeller fold protein YncE